MTKRMLLMLVLVGLVFGGIFGFQAFKARMIKKYIAAQGIPAQTVSTIKAGYSEWQPRVEAVGTLRAVRGADLAPQIAGIVTAVRFKSGDEVKAGAPLIDLDSAQEAAQLLALEAAAQLAEVNYARDARQLKVKAVSQAVVDADAANLKAARAQVAQQQALIDKKRIRAPFGGRLGIRAVDLGQYVSPGTKLVTLQSLDPIFVDFSVPQSMLGSIAVGQEVVARSDAFPGVRFEGKVTAIDAEVDTATRNIAVRAELGNPKHRLLPGMFATVDVESGVPQRHLTLPQTSISYNPYGDTVFVVDEQGKGADGKPRLVAQQRFVTTGATRGDQVAVLSGIKDGETVVTAGQMKLHNGVPVVINNAVQPTDNPAPHPKDE
ncbi:MAG TPA: efflux RND transporter periplasmic adaptor subunit [Burkholderiales bacterium]|nr:efflux RND transporter periplasmic adaptor subunit [Burkholderiales bacterium]